jgi:hypothetical protein
VATDERLWLSLTDRYLYEHDEEDLQLRREVVETGTTCARGNASLHRALLMYGAQCEQAGSCQTQPSVPYRRLAAKHTLRVQLPYGTDNVTISVQEANTMSRLPALLSTDAATWIAVGQLSILVLVAAVSFVRSSQKAVSPSYILRHAFDRCIKTPNELALHSMREVVVNAVIGVLALGSRIAVVAASGILLAEDNATRVVIAEVVGCSISLTHFLLRNAILRTELEWETPLTKLGGPMSTIDVSCAILVALAETPLLATRQTFSSVGRMLASLLILVSGVQTLVYSAAACAMTGTCVSLEQKQTSTVVGFSTILYLATVLWLAQSVCVSITLCSTFIYPFVFSLTRMSTGDTTITRVTALFGVICTGLPMINRVTLSFARGLSSRRQNQDEAEEKHEHLE